MRAGGNKPKEAGDVMKMMLKYLSLIHILMELPEAGRLPRL